MCDSFIFSDYGLSEVQVRSTIENINACSLSVGDRRRLPLDDKLTCKSIWRVAGALGPEISKHDLRGQGSGVSPTWGYAAQLERRITDKITRPITLLFLNAEAVATYRNFFSGKAPRVLCIKRCGAGFGGGWTNFTDWDEPLGRAVAASGAFPSLLVADTEHNWPGYRLWQKFQGWSDSPKCFIHG